MLTALESDTVSHGAQAAKLVVEQLKPLLDRLNIIYDSVGGVKTTVTQEDLDGVPSFSDLTKAQLDAGMFALTATLKTAIDNAYTALVELAARG